MGLFQFDTRPGPGIPKNAPKKKGFALFQELIGRKLGKLVQVNLLYVVALIPTFLLMVFLSGFLSKSILSLQGVTDVVSALAQQSAEAVGDANLVQQQYGAVMMLLDTFLRIGISILFVVFWGMGPATAGVTYILRNLAQEEHAWVWADFRDTVKQNWKQSLCVFLVDMLVLFVLYLAFITYAYMQGPISYLKYIIITVFLVYTLMHFYIYPLMVTFELKLKDIYRNAFLLAIGKLPISLLTFGILFLIHVGGAYLLITVGDQHATLWMLLFLLLECLLLLSLSAFIVNFNVYPRIKECMMPNQKEEM